MNYLYVSIISVVSSIIVYIIFKFKSNSTSGNTTTIETKKELSIKTESEATSEIKIDGNKLEKDLKKSYDEMVGRL